jgi:hypothetical protein
MAKKVARDSVKMTRALALKVMREMGSRGGKRSLETMTPEERVARAKKASEAAAAKRTAMRLEAERARKRGKKPRKKA